jgi:hypothetical protein
MKKLVTLLTLMAGASLGLSQGNVNFNDNVNLPAGFDHKVYSDVVGGTKLVGTNWVAELYSGADASSLAPIASSISKFRVTSTSQPGTWNGKSIALAGGGVGVPMTLDVKVWDITQFATYEAAVAGGGITGDSGAYIYTQLSSTPPDAVGDVAMKNQPAFALVPEPSAIALSVMGVAGLLLIRRRK